MQVLSRKLEEEKLSAKRQEIEATKQRQIVAVLEDELTESKQSINSLNKSIA